MSHYTRWAGKDGSLFPARVARIWGKFQRRRRRRRRRSPDIRYSKL